MLISKFKQELPLYLLSIKQAFESDAFTRADRQTLKALFEHGFLYLSVLDHEELCSEAALKSIVTFGKLIEETLSAPVITSEFNFSYLQEPDQEIVGDPVLPDYLRARAETLFRTVVIDLMSIFQLAIFDLSVQLKTTKTMPPEDSLNTQYVIGMAEITAGNFGTIVANVGEFDTNSYLKLQKFFVDATRFAAALKQSRVGTIN
jgi:hypothetical protein